MLMYLSASCLFSLLLWMGDVNNLPRPIGMVVGLSPISTCQRQRHPPFSLATHLCLVPITNDATKKNNGSGSSDEDDAALFVTLYQEKKTLRMEHTKQQSSVVNINTVEEQGAGVPRPALEPKDTCAVFNGSITHIQY